MRPFFYKHHSRKFFSAQLGIGIEETNAGIGIPASQILVRYRAKKMPDCASLVRYRTCSGIVSFFQSGTGLTGCQTVWHSDISIYKYMDIDMDMQHGHGHALWTWTCSMGMDTQHSFDNVACIWTMDMHGCRNANKKFSPASLVFCLFSMLSPASAFRHRGQSGTASHGLVVSACPAMLLGNYSHLKYTTYKS